MKKNELFKLIPVSYRFEKYIVDAIDEEHAATNSNKNDIVKNGLVKTLKIKAPRIKVGE